MKKCIKCGAMKPVYDFGVYSRNKDKRNNVCKSCRNADVRIKRLFVKKPIQSTPKFNIGDYVVASSSAGKATFLIKDIHFCKISYYLFLNGQKLPIFAQDNLRKATKFEELVYRFFKWIQNLGHKNGE